MISVKLNYGLFKGFNLVDYRNTSNYLNMGRCYISPPITTARTSASISTAASASGKLNSCFSVQPHHTLSDHKPQKKHNISIPARTRYIKKGPTPSVCAEIAENSISAKERMKESWKAAVSVKCGATTLKREPKEIAASAVNAKLKTTNRRNSVIPFIVAPLKNSLDQYQILMYPLVTESAMKNMIENNTLVFLVDVRSDKANIKDAFEMICKIRTIKVNTLTTYRKTKKAFIKLGPDHDAMDVAKKFKFI